MLWSLTNNWYIFQLAAYRGLDQSAYSFLSLEHEEEKDEEEGAQKHATISQLNKQKKKGKKSKNQEMHVGCKVIMTMSNIRNAR